MRTAFFFIWLSGAVALAAPQFQSTKQGFVWKDGPNQIRFDHGRWQAGIDDGATLSWHEFFWHDRWIYESLPAGKVTTPPALAEDGSISMTGSFSARDNSPPVNYIYLVKPLADGVSIKCTLKKSGPLALDNGVWLRIAGDKKTLKSDYRYWLDPAGGGPLKSNFRGTGRRLHVELAKGRAISFGNEGLHEANAENPQNFSYRMNLLREDFEPSKPLTIEYQVRFGAIPAKLPGDIVASKGPAAIRRVVPSAEKVAQYGKLELAVDLAATYVNPFDPDEVKLDATFTTPSGKQIVVPGFFMVRYARQLSGGNELLVPQDGGGWYVRFTPREQGKHTWKLTLQDKSKTSISGGDGAFIAIAPQTQGFIRRSSADPHYLAFDSGLGYFAIGHNVPTYHTSGQTGEEAMRKLAFAKENYNRWWMTSNSLGLEWTETLGWYKQDASARLDVVLDLAQEAGLYYMLCMDTHQDYREKGWERNPFNAKNGGPCKTPADWFTNDTAKEFYRKRLRYTVARWGYSPNVLCWEFGNEIEGWDKSPDSIKLPWTKEMADYLREIDPYKHLITTSFWTNTGPEEYWKLDNIDIVQTHLYTGNDTDVSPQVRECCLRQWEKFAKPHIFGEFGIRAGPGTADKDPKGWAIHNSLWTGLMSFAAGGPMPWWHEEYLDKFDLYYHFTSIANFTADLPLGSAAWGPAQIAPPDYLRKKKPELRDVVIAPASVGLVKPEHDQFTLLSDGTFSDNRKPPQRLHGQGHKDLRHPPTFTVTYPVPGKFIVHVGRVSRQGRLQIWLDDKKMMDQELPCDKGLGKESIYREQWKLWETDYDKDFSIDVPPGQHRIKIDNAGKDWVTITRYVFTSCRIVDRPDILACGMSSKDFTVLWLHNRESTWFNHAGKTPVSKIDPFQISVAGLARGSYRVQWWETWKGKMEREEQLDVTGDSLLLKLPGGLTTDVAVKIKKR